MSTKIGSRTDLDTNVRTFVICWPILTVRVRPTWSLWSPLSCSTYARVLQTPGILKIDPSPLTITHIHCQGSTSVTSFTVAEKFSVTNWIEGGYCVNGTRGTDSQRPAQDTQPWQIPCPENFEGMTITDVDGDMDIVGLTFNETQFGS